MKYIYKTKPWEHQLKALSYLYKRDCAALYTDMGTGKTKVMIDLIQNRDFKRVLVVAPNNRPCEVWEQQIAIHGIAGKFKVLRLDNLPKAKVIDQLLQMPKWTKFGSQNMTYVLIINYEKVWRHNIDKVLMRKTLGIDCVICDESHRIKSPTSKCSRYLARLGAKVSHKYLVTGTPLAETPIDVYAQYKFLDPSIFGTNFTAFRDEYENVDITKSARVGFRILDKKNPYKNLDELHKKMFSCAFLAKSSVKLPAQFDIEWKFCMPEKTEKLYHRFLSERAAELKGLWVESNNVLTTMLRLRQIVSGYLPVEDINTGDKSIINVDHERALQLRDLLKELPQDEPVVIFVYFKKDLKNIKKVCKMLNIGYSEVSGTHDTLDRWRKGLARVVAIQYKSGSESIDLTKARYCIYYSQTRSLSLYEQSRKRIHRPGQTKSVFYYHLLETMNKGQSIDQKMYASLKNKKNIVDVVMEEGFD